MNYFTIAELCKSATARRMNIDNTPSAEVVQNLIMLVENILDPLREAWGTPIVINSGYRCLRLNKVVGGVTGSQHLLGQAADIRTVGDNPADNRRLLDLLVSLKLPFDQLINEYPDRDGNPDWIHVSYSSRHRRMVMSCVRGKYLRGLDGSSPAP
ncbi:MAG: peptidase M15 [Muribaculaceae bacterium]|nr:peptidase M15 [Muribaculaceae bacterium]